MFLDPDAFSAYTGKQKEQIDYMRQEIRKFYCSKYPWCHAGCPCARDDANEVWCCIANQTRTTIDELTNVYKRVQKYKENKNDN